MSAEAFYSILKQHHMKLSELEKANSMLGDTAKFGGRNKDYFNNTIYLSSTDEKYGELNELRSSTE